MDRLEPGLVKWSPNAAYDTFLHINLQHRTLQVFEATGIAQPGHLDCRPIYQHDDFPLPTTYDWAPALPGLVAVGTSTGIVNLLRIDDGSNAYLELGGQRSARVCHAVAFNTSNLLAVGLDRVRSGQSLYVWDLSRLSSAVGDSSKTDRVRGFPSDISAFVEPVQRLESNVSVSSLKFFEDNPQVLVAGIKGQGIRIRDLRESSHSRAINFTTKCNNNLAIDFASHNYFASSALDQPAVMVWDRRTTSRPVASPAYLDAVDSGHLPWGGALRLDSAMASELDPAMSDTKESFIRSLRFNRDHPGMLAILSRTGQLKVLSTRHECLDYCQSNGQPLVTPTPTTAASPRVLEVRRSHELDPLYHEPHRRNDRIVSFDWITHGSAYPRPRVLSLRANGTFDILEKPSATADYPFKFIPWTAPHRGLEGGTIYHEAIDLEPSYTSAMFRPRLIEEAFVDVPLFGPQKADTHAILRKALKADIPSTRRLVSQPLAARHDLPPAFHDAIKVADKLRALRTYASQQKQLERPENGQWETSSNNATALPPSQREYHHELLAQTMGTWGWPDEAVVFLDHVMLLRAKERYLLNPHLNQVVVADDPWLSDVWAWVAGAEEAMADGGMMSNPLDLSYMSIYSIWRNDLGSKRLSRLVDAAEPVPHSRLAWERCLGPICKGLSLPLFDGVPTQWPYHRQLCLDMTRWGRPLPSDEDEDEDEDDNDVDPCKLLTRQDDDEMATHKTDLARHTRAAARALFRGDKNEAVQVLKRASKVHPELLFVSLALQLMGKDRENGGDGKPNNLDFDEHLASKTDPYLRSISSIIATQDWATIACQPCLPLRDRAFVAIRYLDDSRLTEWLDAEVRQAIQHGDISAIVLTGLTDRFVDILARYVAMFKDYQTAALLLSFTAPRFMDDIRAMAFRNAYRAYLQRHKAFYHRTKFEVESMKRSKHHSGVPTLEAPAQQIALRCVYCDAELSLKPPRANVTTATTTSTHPNNTSTTTTTTAANTTAAHLNNNLPATTTTTTTTTTTSNPLTEKMVGAGIACPTCKRHLPRCIICLEVVGMPRSDRPERAADPATRLAARFPTFCLQCEHILHLDHARLWFARHHECPVPECRCRCNWRANAELNYR